HEHDLVFPLHGKWVVAQLRAGCPRVGRYRRSSRTMRRGERRGTCRTLSRVRAITALTLTALAIIACSAKSAGTLGETPEPLIYGDDNRKEPFDAAANAAAIARAAIMAVMPP